MSHVLQVRLNGEVVDASDLSTFTTAAEPAEPTLPSPATTAKALESDVVLRLSVAAGASKNLKAIAVSAVVVW